MIKEAEMQNFESAAFWRDKLQAIENSTENQNVLLDYNANKDTIGYYNLNEYFAIVIIHIREGRILNKSPFELDLREKLILKEEILPSLIQQYYQDNQQNLPDAIVIPELSQEFGLIKELLNDIRTGLQIRLPIDENEEALIRIANKNAKVMVEQQIQMDDIKKKYENQLNDILEEAKELLNLPTLPRIIEGFDISNIEGNDATGSMVYFLEGKPYNKNYRHYSIRFKSTPDDVAMMKEVIRRRYTFLLENESELPDLILVDGGKGQVNAANSVLKELSIENIPVIGLAKKYEEIYIPNEKEPIILPENSSILKLFQKVRDEAHRFAIKLHKQQRQKKITRSTIDNIKGIGPVTKIKLLKHFGSIEGIKKASFEEISKIIGKKKAELLLKNLI
jgi:excinuclease ABC subunit C